MGRGALISTTLLALAAIGALAIIVFNINWRGHYIYCGSDGCLSMVAIERFSFPFAFLFVKYAVALFGLWFVGATILKITKNLSRRHGSIEERREILGSSWNSER
jgi:hypothetical protein